MSITGWIISLRDAYRQTGHVFILSGGVVVCGGLRLVLNVKPESKRKRKKKLAACASVRQGDGDRDRRGAERVQRKVCHGCTQTRTQTCMCTCTYTYT